MNIKEGNLFLTLFALILLQGAADGIVLEKNHFLEICDDYNKLSQAGFLFQDVVTRITKNIASAFKSMIVASIPLKNREGYGRAMQNNVSDVVGNNFNSSDVISEYMQATSDYILFSLVGMPAEVMESELGAVVDLIASILALIPASTDNTSDSVVTITGSRQLKESPFLPVDCQSMPFPDKLDTNDTTSAALALVELVNKILELRNPEPASNQEISPENPEN